MEFRRQSEAPGPASRIPIKGSCPLFSGVHGGARLCSRRSTEVSCSGREGGEGQRGQGGPLPSHALGHGEAGGPEGLLSLQGNVALTLSIAPPHGRLSTCSPLIAANRLWL